MCGICGEIRFDGVRSSAAVVERMAEQLAPRGPDGSGVYAQGPVAFGHRRLKIIDLSENGAQPFVDTQLGMTIAFNGCVYNYRELRAELADAGYSFASTSDTEVILKAWHAWGEAACDRFHGMFAFVIHDRASGRIAMVRDRFGIKPLYYSQGGDCLRFASTLPALVAAGGIDTSIDSIALHHYMTWHAVVPAPRTILAGVRKLPPATIRTIEADGATSDRVYWCSPRRPSNASATIRKSTSCARIPITRTRS
jgi:asparagine synthase (glutamine-hydrolysing)